MKRQSNILPLVFNNLEFKEFVRFKHIYDWSSTFYNNKELNRKSGLPYMTHINDILCLATNDYKIHDPEILNISLGHDILEENEHLYYKTNKEKGYKRVKLEKKLLDVGYNKFEIEGIKNLTHDEDISKLAKVSKVISSDRLRYIIVKSLDIMANSYDHPEELKFTSKLSKIHQADLMINYLEEFDKNKLIHEHKYIKPKKFEKIISDLIKSRKDLFELTLEEKIRLEDIGIYKNKF